MEKIKSLLHPGKRVDDETLYCSRHGSNPIVDRLSENNSHGGLYSSATSPPKPVQSAERGMSSHVDSKDHASITQRPSNVKDDAPISSTTGRSEASKADANANLLATREADKLSTGETNRSSTNEGAGLLRPEYPTPASAGSNASIKSNVVGKVPTGSSFAQEQGTLPQIAAPGEKFMKGPLESQKQGSSSNTNAFPLGASSTSTDPIAGSSRQTELGKRLDPSLNEPSTDSTVRRDTTDTIDTRDHQGRDALLGAGAAGAVGTGAYALSQNKERTGQESSQVPISNDNTTAAPLAQSSGITAASRPTQSRGLTDDIRSRHIPGAWPQTPANESEKTLGSDAAGVGSGAAVIAAQKAYGKHTPEQASNISPSTTHRAEPTPYTSSLDPRVDDDATTRSGPSHQAAGAAFAAGTFASGAAVASKADASPQGTFGEKIQDAQEHEAVEQGKPAFAAATTAFQPKTAAQPRRNEVETKDQDNNKKYAVAGAAGAAAVGAGAYGYSEYNDRDEIPRQNEPFPALHEQPGRSTVANDALTSGTTTTAPLLQTTEHCEPTGREFPLADSQEQSATSKPTNFSYPTGTKETTSQPRVDLLSGDKPVPKEAAENGAAGAGGVAAYEALKHDERTTDATRPATFDDSLASRAHPRALEGYDDQRAAPVHGSHVTGHEPGRPVEAQDDHSKRDAALVGAGVVGGGAAAGALTSQHQPDDRLEKENARTAEKKHEEALKSEDKRRKEEEKHHKSEEKHRKSEEKHRRKSDEDKEHKHGLLHRILHRKSKDEVDNDDEPRQSTEKSRASYDQPTAPVAEKEAFQAGEPYEKQAGLPAEDSSPVGSSSGTPEHSKHTGRNRLHKDPPPGWYENNNAQE